MIKAFVKLRSMTSLSMDDGCHVRLSQIFYTLAGRIAQNRAHGISSTQNLLGRSMGGHRHFPMGIQTQKKNAKPQAEKTVQYNGTNIKN
jgi:hypothetical protein